MNWSGSKNILWSYNIRYFVSTKNVNEDITKIWRDSGEPFSLWKESEQGWVYAECQVGIWVWPWVVFVGQVIKNKFKKWKWGFFQQDSLGSNYNRAVHRPGDITFTHELVNRVWTLTENIWSVLDKTWQSGPTVTSWVWDLVEELMLGVCQSNPQFVAKYYQDWFWASLCNHFWTASCKIQKLITYL